VYGLAWADKKLKNWIFTLGTTLAGNPSSRVRHRVIATADGTGRETERYHKEVPQPKVIEDAYREFGLIDQHDLNRQGYLNLVEGWRTELWWKRAFTTITGVTVTDSYNMYSNDYGRKLSNNPAAINDRTSFNRTLFVSMIRNQEGVVGVAAQRGQATPSYAAASSLGRRARSTPTSSVADSAGDDEGSQQEHALGSLTSLPFYAQPRKVRKDNGERCKTGVKRTCVVCRDLCSHYCVGCSSDDLYRCVDDLPAHKICCICSPTAGKACFELHIKGNGANKRK
jgi:hypothetical protein